MTITAAKTTVGATPTLLHSAVGSSGLYHQALHVTNTDGLAAVFLGGPDVTSTTGFPLDAGKTLTMPLTAGEQLYAITAAGTVAVGTLAIPSAA